MCYYGIQGGDVMQCVSISYKNADSKMRGRFAFSAAMRCEIMRKLCDGGSISQIVMLCTCSRTEVYFCGNDGSRESVINALSERGGIGRDELLTHLRFYSSDKAIRHIFRVACGIDSMVIGEDEILGQVKNAYYESLELKTVSYELNMIFQAAIACAKKIKTETALSKTSVSTATLAANEAARLGENVNVLLIGASGKIGSTVLKNLLSHKNVRVTATLRQHGGDLKIFADPQVKAVDYSKRYEAVNEADCIISATSSPHYTMTLHELKGFLTVNKSRLFIDLAVPADIDAGIVGMGNTKLIGIDHFEKLASENNALKLDSAEEAKRIIADEIDILKKDMLFHDFLPFIGSVRGDISDRLLFRLKSELNAEQLSAVLRSVRNL